MKKIKRSMIVDEEIKGDSYLDCQASFNSDGGITLRNYSRHNKNKDEIIILSNNETRAIMRLFSEIGSMNKSYTLPF